MGGHRGEAGTVVTGGDGEVLGGVNWKRLLNGSRVMELLYRLEVTLKGRTAGGGGGVFISSVAEVI